MFWYHRPTDFLASTRERYSISYSKTIIRSFGCATYSKARLEVRNNDIKVICTLSPELHQLSSPIFPNMQPFSRGGYIIVDDFTKPFACNNDSPSSCRQSCHGVSCGSSSNFRPRCISQRLPPTILETS